MHSSRFSIRHALLLSAIAAACAAPMFSAQAAPPSDGVQKVRAMHRSEGGEPYALVREGSRLNMTGNHIPNADIEAIKRGVQGEFFWFRKDGKDYIVQDAAVLERVRVAWAPMEKTGAEMEKHGKEMGRHGDIMGKYGSQMALAAATLDKDKMEAIGNKMEDAGKPMEALGKQMGRARAKAGVHMSDLTAAFMTPAFISAAPGRTLPSPPCAAAPAAPVPGPARSR